VLRFPNRDLSGNRPQKQTALMPPILPPPLMPDQPVTMEFRCISAMPPTKLMKNLDYGKNTCMITILNTTTNTRNTSLIKCRKKEYYKPGEFGFERDIAKRLEWWMKLRNK
jgi:putative ATPase